jgi:hypothetical protein
MRSVDNLVRLANRFERIVKRAQNSSEEIKGAFNDMEFNQDRNKILRLQNLMNEYFESKGQKTFVYPDGVMGPNTLKSIELAKNNIQSDGGGVMSSNQQILNYLEGIF